MHSNSHNLIIEEGIIYYLVVLLVVVVVVVYPKGVSSRVKSLLEVCWRSSNEE